MNGMLVALRSWSDFSQLPGKQTELRSNNRGANILVQYYQCSTTALTCGHPCSMNHFTPYALTARASNVIAPIWWEGISTFFSELSVQFARCSHTLHKSGIRSAVSCKVNTFYHENECQTNNTQGSIGDEVETEPIVLQAITSPYSHFLTV